jgi:hypothetical protein
LSEQFDIGVGIGCAVVETDGAGDSGSLEDADFNGRGTVGDDSDRREEFCDEIGGLGLRVVEVFARELSKRGEITELFDEDVVVARCDIGYGEAAVEEGCCHCGGRIATLVAGSCVGDGVVDDRLQDDVCNAGGEVGIGAKDATRDSTRGGHFGSLRGTDGGEAEGDDYISYEEHAVSECKSSIASGVRRWA